MTQSETFSQPTLDTTSSKTKKIKMSHTKFCEQKLPADGVSQNFLQSNFHLILTEKDLRYKISLKKNF